MYKHRYIKYALLFICFIHFGAGINASIPEWNILQSSKVSLNMKNASFKDIFNKIEEQTTLVFIYNNNDVDEQKRANIRALSESVDLLLDRLLKNTDLTYSVNDKYIILKKRNIIEKDETLSVDRVKQNQKKITGQVSDINGDPLVGATVLVKGSSSNSTMTDIDGNFTLNVPDNATIIITYLGFLPKEIVVGNQTNFVVVLDEDSKTLDEVLVVGFARQKKANLTGAVSGIKMDDILKDRPVATTATLLQGTIPGLQVTSGTGEPGAGFSFNIRGTTSINSGGSPLVLVDNVPLTGPLNLLNPDDIESVSVLKDGGAAAIYGARGAFGVVLITTKGAKLDQKTKVSYTGNIAFTTPGQLPAKESPLRTVQAFKDFGFTSWQGRNDLDKWIELIQAYNSDPSLYPDGYAMDAASSTLPYFLKEYDQMRDFLGETGFQQIHNVSVSGGSAKTSYRLSLGYTDSDGVVVTDKDSYRKYSLRSFINTEMTSWLTGQLDVNYYKSKKTMPNNADWSMAVAVPSFTPTGTWNVNGEDLIIGTPGNRVRMSALNNDQYMDTRMTGRLIAKPVKDLTITGELTYDHLTQETVNYANRYYYAGVYMLDKTETVANSIYDNTKRATSNTVFNLFASYDKSFEKHKFTILGGYNAESYHMDYLNGQATQMINDKLPSLNQSIGEKVPNDGFSEYALMGFFGRINYSFLDRYLLEINGRYDGSSKFPPNHRWGLFPSISAGWRISEEPFMANIKSIIPELKLRASYSTLGNQNIAAYSFVDGMGTYYPWVNDYARTIALNTPGLVSSDYTWETIESTNMGVDITMFGGRFDLVFDLYNRKTKDMLDYGAITYPAVLGTAAPLQNVADLQTKGWEIDLKWRDRIGKVGYNIGFNLYDYKAKITRFPSNETKLISNYYEGYQMGTIWGYVTDRYYTEDDFENGVLKPGIAVPDGVNPKPGDVLFKDFDEDGKIMNARTADELRDQKIIGNNSLRFQYGINGGINWNNFDFSFYIQGVGKRDLWVANELTFPGYYQWGSLFTHLSDYWTPDNIDAKFPRVYQTGTSDRNYSSNVRAQTRYLQNGAYLRVKNIAFGYTIPASITKKCGVNQVKINTSVENPFLFHHLPKGMDPTLDNKGRGIGYPVMRIYSFGLSLNF
ncbi:MAG: TonB-dependent receptor [Prevotella sp.]|jgi:TonB-linked SusC/RagA family outer membrane protein|nr:TonB-dependent receptor [Prevotella sp.]